MPDPLLSYRTATRPAPLQASSPGTPVKGTINLAVTPPPGGQDVYCDQIKVAVPANEQNGGAFFTEQPVFSTSSDKWVITTFAQIAGQELGLEAGTTWWRAIFHPVAEEYDLIRDPVAFGLSGTLSTSTGSLTYLILEHSGTTTDRSSYTNKKAELTLVVTEPVFYLQSFLARGSEATAPQTKFAGGSPVHLSWESNGAFFRLYDGDGQILHQGPETFFTLENGVSNDTTFTLEASMSPETQGNGFEPIYQYATLTVTVTDPTLDRLTVSGLLSARAGVEVAGTLSANEDLTVSGLLSARARVEVAGTLSANEDLTVSGALSANSDLTVVGDLNAHGNVSAVNDDKIFRIRELRGPNGSHLSVNSSVDVLSGCDVSIHDALRVSGHLERGGSTVVADGDRIGLNNTHYPGWLYASAYHEDGDRRKPFVWDPGNRVVESYWQVSRD
ncbi:hypothetical protein [Streptomyces sp. MP131-18]|uniref:hypothetical protein n=1 Tax=Streptomyces sp. MP131-18 TaxID=1857892 RepID=UPI00097CA30A|nr:hypothetical protein [Streptomyces sp. MP131-18]ONK14052.1 hypothetical protein STBA_48310 [Streptomyces sp. MP131-18]